MAKRYRNRIIILLLGLLSSMCQNSMWRKVGLTQLTSVSSSSTPVQGRRKTGPGGSQLLSCLMRLPVCALLDSLGPDIAGETCRGPALSGIVGCVHLMLGYKMTSPFLLWINNDFVQFISSPVYHLSDPWLYFSTGSDLR